jgi:hypothetical protein
MGWIKQTIGRIIDWFNRNFTFKGLIAALVFLAKEVPDAFGRKDFWSTHLVLIWKVISAHSTISTIVACALVIWLDHRRVLEKRDKKPHDLRTLKGRTEKLTDDLEEFLKRLGERPSLVYDKHMSAGEYAKANEESRLWVDRLHYGFLLHFHDRLKHLYLEFGECGKAYLALAVALEAQVQSEKNVQQIIEILETMAGSL